MTRELTRALVAYCVDCVREGDVPMPITFIREYRFYRTLFAAIPELITEGSES